MSAKFHFINHACFMLEKNNSAIIFDPYLDDNSEGLTAKDIKVDYIFVSHGHFDHLGSAFEIAKNCDATIISTAEICGLAQEAGCKAHAMHLGGTFKFPFGKVRLTLAFHGSGVPGGHACGIVIDFYGTKLYFAGDTALFSDMQLLPKLDAFEYAVLPIGGNFTMDPMMHLSPASCCRQNTLSPYITTPGRPSLRTLKPSRPPLRTKPTARCSL